MLSIRVMHRRNSSPQRFPSSADRLDSWAESSSADGGEDSVELSERSLKRSVQKEGGGAVRVVFVAYNQVSGITKNLKK